MKVLKSFFLPAMIFLFFFSADKLPARQNDDLNQDINRLYNFSKVFSRVAKKVRHGVVYITGFRSSSGAYRSPRQWHPLFEFFGEDFFKRRQPQGRRFEQRVGDGSGFIVDAARGIILTNNHVVRYADKIIVRLDDRRELSAKLLGNDPKSDVAVLQVNADRLTGLKLGDSNKIQVGDWVLAIGNPFGLSQTVTQGIISAKGRSSVGIAEYENFIQTDAAINPGNSGGPLVNLKGEVIGINTAILSRSGGSAGIGFALPINMARSIMEQVLNTGTVSKGWLGVTITNPNPKDYPDGNVPTGALVMEVFPNGPADKAGIKNEDIIMKVDSTPIESANGLIREISTLGPNKIVEVEILRSSGKIEKLNVTLGMRPKSF
ncbi:trypsin-like peptidase domain-containing protein [Candidatus Riflebacteria bacterium]